MKFDSDGLKKAREELMYGIEPDVVPAIIEAYLRASNSVIVPKEPTEEMHAAARDWSLEKYGRGVGRDGSEGCYRAMIKASQEAQ